MKKVYVVTTNFDIADINTGEIIYDERPLLEVASHPDIAADVATERIKSLFWDYRLRIRVADQLEVDPLPDEFARYESELVIFDRLVRAVAVVREVNYRD